jgi:hypothetical protein
MVRARATKTAVILTAKAGRVPGMTWSRQARAVANPAAVTATRIMESERVSLRSGRGMKMVNSKKKLSGSARRVPATIRCETSKAS